MNVAPPEGEALCPNCQDQGCGHCGPARVEDEPWYDRNNAVKMKPWVWATLPLHGPVEVVSYPWYEDGVWQVNVRMKVGDPTSMKTVKARMVACFDPSSHEDYYREKVYYSDNPTAFHFKDELP